MKVTNPKPCLVNVYVDGDYVRIGPNQTKDVPEQAVAALIKTGALVKADGDGGGSKKPAGKPASKPADGDGGGPTEPAAKKEQ